MQAQESSPTTSPGPGNPTSSSPSRPLFDGETDQPSQSTDGGDMEAAVSFGSMDASLSGDNEADTSWNSWRSKDSDETDVSHNSAKTKDSDHSAVSSVNTFASASESMGSQGTSCLFPYFLFVYALGHFCLSSTYMRYTDYISTLIINLV